MAITRYAAPRPTAWGNFDVFNRLLNDTLVGREMNGSEWMPAVEITESADQLTLSAELPGLTTDDIGLDFENGVLTLRGEKKAASETEGDRYHVVERRYGSFQRTFTLPRTVDPDAVSAEFDNGILTVHLPKAAAAKSRSIQIQGTE